MTRLVAMLLVAAGCGHGSTAAIDSAPIGDDDAPNPDGHTGALCTKPTTGHYAMTLDTISGISKIWLLGDNGWDRIVGTLYIGTTPVYVDVIGGSNSATAMHGVAGTFHESWDVGAPSTWGDGNRIQVTDDSAAYHGTFDYTAWQDLGDHSVGASGSVLYCETMAAQTSLGTGPNDLACSAADITGILGTCTGTDYTVKTIRQCSKNGTKGAYYSEFQSVGGVKTKMADSVELNGVQMFGLSADMWTVGDDGNIYQIVSGVQITRELVRQTKICFDEDVDSQGINGTKISGLHQVL